MLAVGRALNECCDEPEKRLMLGPVRAPGEKRAKLNVRKTAARGTARLVYDEGAAILRLPAEIPGIAIWASIQFSSLGHMLAPPIASK